MASERTQGSAEHRDFFISYTGVDRAWAEWIAWQLEEAGYTTISQAWDFHAGNNFVQEMDKATRLAERTIAVLSPDYFQSKFTPAEWQAAFRRDPTSEQGLLLPVRVRACDGEGLLGAIVYINLVDLDADAAREYLLARVRPGRAKPTRAPAFPVARSTFSPAGASPAFPGLAPSIIWNVPFTRNPFFTGREEELTWLREQLQQGKRAAIGQAQAISGLGGIGKTQLAVEYAYRSRQEYQAILWARADSLESLNASYSKLARLLDLPEQVAREQEVVVQAVKAWLQTHDRWLLVLDNLDEPDVLFPTDEHSQPSQFSPFLPSVPGGHLLITSRASDLTSLNIGVAHALAVEKLPAEQSASLLLRRANLLASDAPLADADPRQREFAGQLNQELDGLPLALDQAGAYLVATGESLEGYLRLFQQSRARLLQQHRSRGYPASVAATWAISFQRVAERNPAAAELLNFLAFLAPDAIPEELLVKGADQLGPVLAPVASDPLQLNDAIEALRAYSLLTRNSREHTLAIHRLVQAVVCDNLSAETHKQWMQRVVFALNAACPDDLDFANWPILERLLPHAWLCAIWVEREQIATLEAALLLNQTGYFLSERARYAEAEPLWQRALAIREQQLGPDRPDTAISLNNLAALYHAQGKYEQAEPLWQRALAICEQQLGPDHPDTAISLNNLAALYRNQGKNKQAESLLQRALTICEQQLGPMHPDTATSLDNLATLYRDQGKDEQAELLYQRALAIREQQLGPMHPDTATSLDNLATLYCNQGKDEQAELLYQRALAIREQQLGPMHPNTASGLNNLAELYRAQGKDEQAELLYQRALVICEQQLGPTHPHTATGLNNLALLYYSLGKYEQAGPLLQRALAIRLQQLGPTHPDTAQSLNNLALLYHAQRKDEQAEPLLQRALTIWEQVLGMKHPHTQQVRKNYAELLRQMGADKNR